MDEADFLVLIVLYDISYIYLQHIYAFSILEFSTIALHWNLVPYQNYEIALIVELVKVDDQQKY